MSDPFRPDEVHPPADGGPSSDDERPAVAEPWRRIVARLLDGVVVGAVIAALGALVDLDSPGRVALLGGIIGGLYETLLITVRGQTLGKALLNIRVVDRRTGAPPDVANAAIRWLLASGLWGLRLPEPLLTVHGLVGLAVILCNVLWLFTDPQRRLVHDRATATLVVPTGT